MLGDAPGILSTKRLHARGRRVARKRAHVTVFREGISGKFLLDRARM
jgi:hypothetical protein